MDYWGLCVQEELLNIVEHRLPEASTSKGLVGLVWTTGIAQDGRKAVAGSQHAKHAFVNNRGCQIWSKHFARSQLAKGISGPLWTTRPQWGLCGQQGLPKSYAKQVAGGQHAEGTAGAALPISQTQQRASCDRQYYQLGSNNETLPERYDLKVGSQLATVRQQQQSQGLFRNVRQRRASDRKHHKLEQLDETLWHAGFRQRISDYMWRPLLPTKAL